MWAVHWSGKLPVVGAIRDYLMVAFTRPFGNRLHGIPFTMATGHCPSRLPEVLSIAYCRKSKCAISRHGGHVAKFWPCSRTTVVQA